MTDDLRELYRSHEYLVDGAADRLLPAVRSRRRRTQIKKRIGYASVALLVVATIGVVVAFGPFRSSAVQVPAQRPPAGYRFESSIGLQIVVPATWKTNDFGCNGDDQPSVVRPGGYDEFVLCVPAAPPTKEFAIIAVLHNDEYPIPGVFDADVSNLVPQNVMIDGIPATRAAGAITFGRFAAWITIPDRDIEFAVRTNSQAELTTILNSVRLPRVDYAGCPTTTPAPLRPKKPTGHTFVDARPLAVSVCYYYSQGLLVSTLRTGAAAAAVASALNAARPGANPDEPGNCLHSAGPQPVDAEVLIYSSNGSRHAVNVTFQSCVGIRLDNGREYRQLSSPLLSLIMKGTDAGYQIGGILVN